MPLSDFPRCPMLSPDFRDALSEFNAASADYLVGGAFAMAAHGLPRATGHIDLWARATPENAERVHRALVAFGAPAHLVDRGDFAAADMIVQIGRTKDTIDVEMIEQHDRRTRKG